MVLNTEGANDSKSFRTRRVLIEMNERMTMISNPVRALFAFAVFISLATIVSGCKSSQPSVIVSRPGGVSASTGASGTSAATDAIDANVQPPPRVRAPALAVPSSSSGEYDQVRFPSPMDDGPSETQDADDRMPLTAEGFSPAPPNASEIAGMGSSGTPVDGDLTGDGELTAPMESTGDIPLAETIPMDQPIDGTLYGESPGSGFPTDGSYGAMVEDGSYGSTLEEPSYDELAVDRYPVQPGADVVYGEPVEGSIATANSVVEAESTFEQPLTAEESAQKDALWNALDAWDGQRTAATFQEVASLLDAADLPPGEDVRLYMLKHFSQPDSSDLFSDGQFLSYTIEGGQTATIRFDPDRPERNWPRFDVQ